MVVSNEKEIVVELLGAERERDREQCEGRNGRGAEFPVTERAGENTEMVVL